MGYIRYHLDTGRKRTTVSLDKTIATLLALKLGLAPDAEDAHAAVREWLQQSIEPFKLKGEVRSGRLSSLVRLNAILFLVGSKLERQYHDWLDASV